jgi:hypothetical protein
MKQPSYSDETLARTVGQHHLELGQEADLGAVMAAVAIGLPADAAAVPTVAQGGHDDVGSGKQQPGHVVGVGHEPLTVGGPAGREQPVADGQAVDGQVVEAQGGHVQPRPGHVAVDGELAAQHRAGRLALATRVIGQRHCLRPPVIRVQEASLDPQDRAPRGPALVGAHAHAVVAHLTALECGTRRRDGDLVGRLHHPGRPVDRPECVIGGCLALVCQLSCPATLGDHAPGQPDRVAADGQDAPGHLRAQLGDHARGRGRVWLANGGHGGRS